ncbi:MAG: hypothetical protein RR232_06440 [Clostridia bacterium]
MKKTCIAMLLVCGMLMTACNAAVPSGAQTGTDILVPNGTAQPKVSSTPTDVLPTPTDVSTEPIPDEVEQKLNAMMPALDSVMRAMGEQTEYAPKDQNFFWSTLYLMGANWSKVNALIELKDGKIQVPHKVMQEFATGAFLDYGDLLPLPSSMEGSIKYDEGMDKYVLSASDAGDAYAMLGEHTLNADGSITLSASLLDWNDTTIGTYTFELKANPYVDGITEPIFYYSIASAKAE